MATTLHRPDRRQPGTKLLLALALAFTLATALPQTVAAQSGQATTAAGPVDPPAGWRHSVGQGVDTYQKGGADAEGVVMVADVPAATAAELDAVTAQFFTTMGCQGTPPAARDGVVGPFGEDTRCFAAFKRSPRGYRVATGATVSLEAEAQGMDLARRLAEAGAAPSIASAAPASAAPPSPEADARTDAALRAALDAVPKAHMPVATTLRRFFRYVGDHMQLDYTVWLLFGNGFATSCMEWDPAVLAPTPEALAAIEKDSSCEISRWKRVGSDAVFADGEKGDTSLDGNEPPPPRGTTYAGEFKSSKVKFSSLMNYGVPGELRIDTEAMSLTRDGRFRLGSEMYTRQNLNNDTTRSPIMTGRYMVDRHLIALAANGKIERHFFLATGKPDDKELILYLDGSLLSNR